MNNCDWEETKALAISRFAEVEANCSKVLQALTAKKEESRRPWWRFSPIVTRSRRKGLPKTPY